MGSSGGVQAMENWNATTQLRYITVPKKGVREFYSLIKTGVYMCVRRRVVEMLKKHVLNVVEN